MCYFSGWLIWKSGVRNNWWQSTMVRIFWTMQIGFWLQKHFCRCRLFRPLLPVFDTKRIKGVYWNSVERKPQQKKIWYFILFSVWTLNLQFLLCPRYCLTFSKRTTIYFDILVRTIHGLKCWIPHWPGWRHYFCPFQLFSLLKLFAYQSFCTLQKN